MRRFVAPVVVFLIAFAVLRAQDAAPPSVDLSSTPSPTVSPTPDVPELSTLDEVYKQSSLGKEADEARVRLQMRRIENEVVHDPAIIAAKQSAAAASTDLDKRERLRDYYRILYGKMRARAGSEDVRRAIDTALTDHLRPISQPNVRPREDDPSPTPTPKKGASPGKDKRKHRFGT